jgi:dTMP kinase
MIKALEVMVQQGLAPDVTLLLDIDVRTGLERARGRAELDRFESESIAFFERVRAAYLERAAADPRRFITIDAGQTLEAVQKDIAEALSVRIEQWQQA